jgi:broad specificity phosphatase PhoE
MRFPFNRPKLSRSFFPRPINSSVGSLIVVDDPIPHQDSFHTTGDAPRIVNDTNGTHELYLYLIRHGEAEHNIREERAMEEARMACLQEGLLEDNPEMKRRMERARKAALNHASLKDANLSLRGRREALQARDKLHHIIEDNSLPRPNCIFVSPLTRTLETCDIIFPGHTDIHVRDALSERHTGKPPDMRSPVSALIRRPEFRHFSMHQLLAQYISERRSVNPEVETLHEEGAPEVLIMGAHDNWEKFEMQNYEFYEENREELRKRTEYLVTLLTETSSESVACVTHKGYLRELERGPFRQEEAPEFKNCEIRVYRVTLSYSTGALLNAERVA